MNIKHKEIIPDKDNPFSQCKLKREPYAKILTEIIRTYSEGFVLAINNEWGTGKTTFVKMWQQQLINEGFPTVYFNAWENDFDSNPLIAIMSELQPLVGKDEKKEEIFKAVMKNGGILIRNVAPALAKALLKKYVVDLDEVAIDLIENATKASTEILETEIKEYAEKKKTIIDFKNEVQNFAKANDAEKPIVFIIDELDRCRPNYSVEVLEQVKHFFSVPGIVFVLSIDKEHLGSAIKGFYGSECINTDEYLRRFIDLEYSIPRPAILDYIAYLLDYYNFKTILLSLNIGIGSSLMQTAGLLFAKSKATLRQQEKIFALFKLILQSFPRNYPCPSELTMVLVFVRTLHEGLFNKIANHMLSLKELSDEFSNLFPSYVEKLDNPDVIRFQAELLILYYNWRCKSQPGFTDENVDEKRKLHEGFRSSLQGSSDGNLLKNYFDDLNNQLYYRRVNLNHLLTKINLLEPLEI